MKQVDFEIIKKECSSIYGYEKNRTDDSGKMILCIVPNMSMNGAQTVFRELLDILRILNDYRFWFISPEDGEYRDIYVNEGAVVCIRPYIVASDAFRKALHRSFDFVILNTALVHGYSMFFVNTEIPVLWWVHESIEHLSSECNDMPNPNLLSTNIHVYGVTDRVKDAFRSLYEFNIPVLHMAIADRESDYMSEKDRNKDKVRFVIPGAYTPIKGQDILLSAIAQLPREYCDRAEFDFCGYRVDGNEEYYNRIIEISSGIDCVHHLGKLDKDAMYKLYADCDCVIAPSRLDSTPTTIVEGMMFRKITMASANCGITRYMSDCVNGFVFNTEDELIKRLLLIISDIDSLGAIGDKGREIWEKHFSPASVLETVKPVFAV